VIILYPPKVYNGPDEGVYFSEYIVRIPLDKSPLIEIAYTDTDTNNPVLIANPTCLQGKLLENL